MDYAKYLKYKKKYLNLKNSMGGSNTTTYDLNINSTKYLDYVNKIRRLPALDPNNITKNFEENLQKFLDSFKQVPVPTLIPYEGPLLIEEKLKCSKDIRCSSNELKKLESYQNKLKKLKEKEKIEKEKIMQEKTSRVTKILPNEQRNKQTIENMKKDKEYQEKLQKIIYENIKEVGFYTEDSFNSLIMDNIENIFMIKLNKIKNLIKKYNETSSEYLSGTKDKKAIENFYSKNKENISIFIDTFFKNNGPYKFIDYFAIKQVTWFNYSRYRTELFSHTISWSQSLMFKIIDTDTIESVLIDNQIETEELYFKIACTYFKSLIDAKIFIPREKDKIIATNLCNETIVKELVDDENFLRNRFYKRDYRENNIVYLPQNWILNANYNPLYKSVIIYKQIISNTVDEMIKLNPNYILYHIYIEFVEYLLCLVKTHLLLQDLLTA